MNIVHTRFLTPYWRVALPPTPIVPIGTRPFHPEHPSVFSDESVFPVQPQVAQKAGDFDILIWPTRSFDLAPPY